ncbi:MAG TPA: phage tail protein [Archangium sp.]|nr:phage tail protein [Archangium sp.]
MTQPNNKPVDPLYTFRFELSFTEDPLSGRGEKQSPPLSGAFSECTGLEATMEPKVIKPGGHNYGAIQRAGPVTFATVVLKRGISRDGSLIRWFERVANGDYGHRYTVRVHLKAPPESPGAKQLLLTWRLERALPIKFKAADFNAKATDVGIEELHLAHEGLFIEPPRTEGG